MRNYDVLIVGAGHGGAQAATALRQKKFTGSIAIIGEEPELPYERPPLSKNYFAQKKSFNDILIHPASFWSDRDISVVTGQRVDRIYSEARTIFTASGLEMSYGQLIWAAGGYPRRLDCSGHDLMGVHAVRSRADVDRITNELTLVSSVVIIGGGFIGLEAAAVLIKLGKKVSVIEARERLLSRVAGVALSRFYEMEHVANGVEIHLASSVVCLEAKDGRVAGVRLQDDTILPAEMVIVGIGIIPSIEPLRTAGACCGNGVEVDEYGRTSLPNIFAIGDCALHLNLFFGQERTRLESVQNANDMATVVAATIAGNPQPYNAVPWFWSNQYDLRLQTVGLSVNHDQEVVRGDPKSKSFSVVYLKNGDVIALDCVNAVKDYVQGRALVVNRSKLSAKLLADAKIPLKEMIEK